MVLFEGGAAQRYSINIATMWNPNDAITLLFAKPSVAAVAVGENDVQFADFAIKGGFVNAQFSGGCLAIPGIALQGRQQKLSFEVVQCGC